MYRPKDNQVIDKWKSWHAGQVEWFVTNAAPKYGIHVMPGLYSIEDGPDARAWDMIVKGKDGKLHPAELLEVMQPFFVAGALYDVDPQFAFTVNLRQIENLALVKEPVVLFFWIKFRTIRQFDIQIHRMTKLYWQWHASFIADILAHNEPVHTYYQRDELKDKANALQSYVIDIRKYATEIPLI